MNSDPCKISLSHDGKAVWFTKAGTILCFPPGLVFHGSHWCLGRVFLDLLHQQEWYQCGTDEHKQIWCKLPRFIIQSLDHQCPGWSSVKLWDFLPLIVPCVAFLEMALVPAYLALSVPISNSYCSFSHCFQDRTGYWSCKEQIHLIPMRSRYSWFLLDSLFRSGLDFLPKGIANIAIKLKLFHSCSIIKITSSPWLLMWHVTSLKCSANWWSDNQRKSVGYC